MFAPINLTGIIYDDSNTCQVSSFLHRQNLRYVVANNFTSTKLRLRNIWLFLHRQKPRYVLANIYYIDKIAATRYLVIFTSTRASLRCSEHLLHRQNYGYEIFSVFYVDKSLATINLTGITHDEINTCQVL